METLPGNGPLVMREATDVASISTSSLSAGSEVAKEDQIATKKIERFDISLENLKMMFENQTEVKLDRTLQPPTPRVVLESQRTHGESNFPNPSADLQQTAGGVNDPRAAQLPEEEDESQQDARPVSLKERLAMYQAAVSKKEATGSSGPVVEESEACSLPGGLASVKKQFESQEIASSQSTVTQFHYQHQSVQEVTSSSEVTVKSIKETVPSTHKVSFLQEEKVSHDHQSKVSSSYENHYDGKVKVIGGEELPKISTQALKQQFEKNIEGATPSKQIKIDIDFHQFPWTPAVNASSKLSTSKTFETSSVITKTEGVTTAIQGESFSSYENLENLPPPPPELLQEPTAIHEQHCAIESSDTSSQSKQTNKEQYSKQRNLYELKRLYKHIHPEVRKNLERDFFSDMTEIERSQLEDREEVTGDVQQARYAFENSATSPIKSVSPEREYMEWDEILKGEVQSMRWMFENKPLDSIKDETPEEESKKTISQDEIIAGSDVKYTMWMFETQPIDALGGESPDPAETNGKLTELAKGDVRTATWLFETQPLDTLNKIYQEEDQTTEFNRKDIAGGDVKTARYLFETQHLDSLGHTETIDEGHFLQLKSELQEIKGDVMTTTKMFETQPLCVFRGDSGEMLEITKVQREETEKGDVKTSRWLFETQPLDIINKDPSQVKLVCGVAMEEKYQGGVNKGRWLFETKTLDSIKDEDWESSKLEKEKILGTDVRKHCWVFETQPMDTLKDNSNARPVSTEEVLGGDVKSARHLFETVPIDALKEHPEVGKLKKLVASEEEKGDVRHQKWRFESHPIENLREEKKELIRTVNLEEEEKGDVTNCKVKFETMDLSKCDEAHKIQVEGVASGYVKSNKALFESTPLYAIQDSSGFYHELRTVRREEIVKGDVRSCKWMFETRPIDQFDESINKFQLIKGISKQEVESGDVKTAKWLFETQPIDSIKYFSNVEDEVSETKQSVEIVRGDVKTCRWLFETQPMDTLYEKSETTNEADTKLIEKGDVKTCTWLFETQSLDAIKDDSEAVLTTCTVRQEDIHGKDVRMARFLFETENLENITGDESRAFKKVTEIDIQSGDVSKMKYIFENQSSDMHTSTSDETYRKLKTIQAEDIQKGNVVNCTWLFENQPIDAIHEDSAEAREIRTVTDIQGGNVDKGRFIFETVSLDKIQAESSETEIARIQKISREQIERGDVKNYTMMFETQPLYAIQDKEGYYHEVTTVTKEDILRGDVVGARWLFETKPLDSIKETDEVYVIKAVTQEDIQKGDVNSARWRFETQPLDKISEDVKILFKTVDDVQGGDVRTNKKRFESEDLSQKYVRTVSVSEITKGDVRTATWMFETHTIDEIRGESAEYDEMDKVTKEELLKGDVKHSVWLFEKQPLDKIKEADETIAVTREEIPQADVKTTTWLFETTPLHEFNESSVEKTEIIGKSIKETLEELYSQKIVSSKGILIEADEIGDIRMAKYRLMNQETPEIQREEIIRGDLKNIMMNLLNRRETSKSCITIDEEERGNLNTTLKQLFSQESGNTIEKEVIIRGNIQEAINNLMKEEGQSKRGILIQEDEKGDIRMTIYSLLNKQSEFNVDKEVLKGNIKGTISILLSNPDNPEQYMRIKVDDTEKGNVNFYTTCIESGAMDYLRELQAESEETPTKVEKEKIVGGDIRGTKETLQKQQMQIERTIADNDIVPGDVHNTVKVFMTEPANSLDNIQKEVVVKGDLKAALDSLTQAINQKMVLEKEEVLKGDIPTALRSLEDAQNQSKEIEKPEIVPGDIKGALESLEKSAATKVEIVIDDIVPGDIKGTMKSLEEAKQAVKQVEKEDIVKGDIHTVMQSLQEASNEKRVCQQQVSIHGDVKGTIQLLLEPPASTKILRRPSTEGDVKTSIKSLYDVKEQIETEKEEIIKGDVQGTIKCLLQKKQDTSTKASVDDSKQNKVLLKAPLLSQPEVHECLVETKESESVKLVPAFKNLSQSTESQISTLKHATGKTMKSKSSVQGKTAVISPKSTIKDQSMKQMVGTCESIILNKKSVCNPMSENTVGMHVSRDAEQNTKNMQNVRTVKQLTENTVTERSIVKQESNTNGAAKYACDMKVTSQVSPNVSQSSNIVKQEQETKSIKQTETSFMEHKTILQKHDVKTVKTEFRNLDTSQKGYVKISKKMKTPMRAPPSSTSSPPLSESELPLPPPPPPIAESDIHTFPTPPPSVLKNYSDLPPPPPPADFPPLPPPPPPQMPGPDYLPPPPSQKELESMPPLQDSSFGQAKTMTVKTVKAPSMYKVPKFDTPKKQEPPPSVLKKQLQKESVTTSDLTTSCKTTKEISKQEKTVCHTPTDSFHPSHSPLPKPPQEQPPSTSKHIFKPLVQQPSPSTETSPTKPKSKFKTPLMIAEERYRQQRAESDKNKGGTALTSLSNEGGANSVICAASITNNTAKETSLNTFDFLTANALKSDMMTHRSKEQPASSVPSAKRLSSETSQLTTTKHHVSSVLSSNTQITPSQHVPSIPLAQPQSAAKDKEGTLKTSLGNNVSKQTSGITSLETAISVTSEATRRAEEPVKHGVGKMSPQPSRIPKATPNFKVKTVKMPKVENSSTLERKSDANKEVLTAEEIKRHVNKMEENVTQVEKVKVAQDSKAKENEVFVGKCQIPKVTAPKDASKVQNQIAKQTYKKADVSPKETMAPMLVKANKKQEVMITGCNDKDKHVQVSKDVIIAESKVQQDFQQKSTFQFQRKLKPSKMHLSKQQIPEQSTDDCRGVSVNLEGKLPQTEKTQQSLVESEFLQKYEEVQTLLNYIKEQQGSSRKVDLKVIKAMLTKAPDWIIDPAAKKDLERGAFNNQKMKDAIACVKNLAEEKLHYLEANDGMTEKPETEPISEKKIIGGATPKISTISIGSAKVETQKVENQKKMKEKRVSDVKNEGLTETKRVPSPLKRVPSPLIRMRSPSPTYITIESTRRTDSPQRVPQSPPPMYRSSTPPTPPPRMSDTSSHLARTVQSPTFQRSEKLAKLKDTTAKLSRGSTPPPVAQPVKIVEKKSEIIESPSSFHRQIKIETHFVETSELSESSMETASVKDKKEFFEVAQKAEVNRTYKRREPIDIPERLGPDNEDNQVLEKEKEELPRVNLSGLVNKFESPEQKVYVRKEPIVIAERLGSDLEDVEPEVNIKIAQEEQMPAFNLKAIKTVFEMGEQSCQDEERRHRQEKLESEMSEILTESSKQANPWKHQKESVQTLPQIHQKEKETVQSNLPQPMGLSESSSVSEQFATVDERGNKISGSRSVKTISQHSESPNTRRAPPTYADVVKGRVPVLDVSAESTPEELLKRFHKTWTETENVFKSLGYSVSEQSTSQVSRSHQQETLRTENTSSRAGAVHSVSEESLPNGSLASRQPKLS